MINDKDFGLFVHSKASFGQIVSYGSKRNQLFDMQLAKGRVSRVSGTLKHGRFHVRPPRDFLRESDIIWLQIGCFFDGSVFQEGGGVEWCRPGTGLDPSY
jgi:hypothetical protein